MAKRFPCGFERVTISLRQRRQLVVGVEAKLCWPKGDPYADWRSDDFGKPAQYRARTVEASLNWCHEQRQPATAGP